MKRKIKEGIKLALEQKPEELKDLIKKVKQFTNTKYGDKRLTTEIKKYLDEYPVAYIKADKKVLYRAEIFKNAKFRIKLTKNEYKTKRLFMGHRFIPFRNINNKIQNLTLSDNQNNKIHKLRVVTTDKG